MADEIALSSLDTAIQNVAALLAEMTTNPKPTYSVGGQMVSWAEYLSTLNGQMEVMMKNRQILYGPIEIRTQGIS